MSKTVAALTLSTLACASACAYLWQELREARADSARLHDQVAQLERTLATPPPAVFASTPEPEPIKTTPPAPSPPNQPVVAVASPALGSAGPVRAGPMDPDVRKRMIESHEQQVRMLKDPEYRELIRTQQKLSMRRMYNDLEPLLGLTQDESDRLLDVLADQAIRSMEERPSMVGFDGGTIDPAAVRKQQQQYADLKRRNDAELAQVLGPKFDEWQAYQSNGWSRSQVMQLRQTLSMSAEPLRQDQIKPLVEAMAYEQKHMGVGVQRSSNHQAQFGQAQLGQAQLGQAQLGMDPQAQVRRSEEWLERSAQSQQRIRDAVSGLLTPRQFQELKEQHAQELKMMELNVKQQRARAEAQARGELSADPALGSWSPVTISTN